MILRFILSSFLPHTKLEEGPHDLRFTASFKKKVRIHLLEKSSIDAIGFLTPFEMSLFVSKDLWARWSEEERETALYWFYAASLRAGVWARLLRSDKVHTFDRDTILLAPAPLSLVGVLEKTVLYRTENPITEASTLLSGLTLLGSPLFKAWPSVQERIGRISDLLLNLH